MVGEVAGVAAPAARRSVSPFAASACLQLVVAVEVVLEARLLRPVIMSTSSRPAATASSTTYWMAGLSTTGSISLGVALVAGRNRVPRPAAGMTALVTSFQPCRTPGEPGGVQGRRYGQSVSDVQLRKADARPGTRAPVRAARGSAHAGPAGPSATRSAAPQVQIAGTIAAFTSSAPSPTPMAWSTRCGSAAATCCCRCFGRTGTWTGRPARARTLARAARAARTRCTAASTR